jgi:xylulokinase
MTYLGIDLGTSGLRALLIDQDGAAIGSTTRHYDVSHPQPGWSEQDPAAWIAALEDAVAELRSQHAQFRDLRGIGVAGHMHGATLIDAGGKVLRPCILWNDTRASAQAAMLDQTHNVRATSGNIVFPGFTAPKLEWVRAHEPKIFAQVHKVLLPAAYLNFYLTGEYVADMSDSAGTSWLDVARREWSDHLLDASHMRKDQMPRLVEGASAAGALRPDVAARWGLSHPVTLAGGAGDNAAAACGIGAMNEGQGFISLGTSGVLMAARDGCTPAPDTAVHTFCHAVPDRWYQMGVMLSATDSLNWLSRITGRSPSALTAALGKALSPPSKVKFLPYLSGERTPHNDTAIRGSLTGLDVATGPEDLAAAVIEGVSFGLRDSLEALKAADAKLDRVVAIGGGTASPYWLELLATVLDLPIALPSGGEFGAALGAARLGMVASGGGDIATVMTAPQISQTTLPNASLRTRYEDAYAAFRNAYPVIKSIQ